MSEPRVDLGFVEKPLNNWQLNSNFFPSKVGGKPAWLDLSELPKNNELQCGKCAKTQTFLCQIYCPDEDNADCFHRTIYLFVCRNEQCCTRNESNNFTVFRSQLKRNNPYYAFEPPDEEKNADWKIESFVSVCNLCGSFADKHCSKCKIVSYCCRDHQIIDWKMSHKQNCGRGELTAGENTYLFDEFEIVIDEEVIEKKEEDAEDAEKRRLSEFKELEMKGELGTMQDCADLENAASGVEDDRCFSKFRKKISENPEQILRYQKGAQPLWIADEPKPSAVPCCENCGSERQFEFQILPQLLYHLHENNLDWGVLCVYTCKKNCSSAKPYKKEFIFKQDVALTNI